MWLSRVPTKIRFCMTEINLGLYNTSKQKTKPLLTRETIYDEYPKLPSVLKMGPFDILVPFLNISLAVVHKLCLQDKLGRWSKNLSTFIPFGG